MSELHLIGIDGPGLSPAAKAIVQGAAAVFCTERFHAMLADFQGDILPVAPLATALDAMAARLAVSDICVLASGDPLFFGIGRRLMERFGPEAVCVHPALSAMQLAFARLREPWEDAAFVSLHGRDGGDLLPILLSRRKVFLFTDRRQPPGAIAARIHQGLAELGLLEASCRVMVAENLGLPGERIVHGSPAAIAAGCFADLNVMIIRLDAPPAPDFGLGLKESEITHSRGLISKDEVRAAILHGLRLPATGVLWDIGAGSGAVGLEAARLCPGLTVFAIERQPEGQANILANRRAFHLANLHLIPGQAPEGLAALPRPDRVFIGGSGGQLAGIVEAVVRQLSANAIVMASAVTEATRQAAPLLFHRHGLRVAISTIAVSRATFPDNPAGRITLNPITLITGSK